MVSKEINTNLYSRNMQYRATLWCTVFRLANLVVCSIMHERASSVTQITVIRLCVNEAERLYVEETRRHLVRL